jgi:hypothetical protein
VKLRDRFRDMRYNLLLSINISGCRYSVKELHWASNTKAGVEMEMGRNSDVVVWMCI